jgi:hypothetical protein
VIGPWAAMRDEDTDARAEAALVRRAMPQEPPARKIPVRENRPTRGFTRSVLRDAATFPEPASVEETSEWFVLDESIRLAFAGHTAAVTTFFAASNEQTQRA